MKKFAELFAVVLLAFAVSFAAACTDGAKCELLESEDKVIAVKALETDESVSLESALTALKEEGKLDFTGTSSETGLFITSVNGYAAGNNEFWAVYTTLSEYKGTVYSDEAWQYDFNGTTLYSANFSVSGLPMVEGELYVIALSTF